MLGIVDSGWWWYMEIYCIHLCFDVFGNFHNKKRFLFWVELENITSADWKTRLLECLSVANIRLWKSLNTWLFTSWKLFEGSDCVLFIFLFVFFFSFIFISWRLITLQYYSGFCHTLTWISHGFTCVPHPDPHSHLLPHPIPLGHPSAPALSTCLMHPTWTGDLFHPW